jgi:hypothetical protein
LGVGELAVVGCGAEVEFPSLFGEGMELCRCQREGEQEDGEMHSDCRRWIVEESSKINLLREGEWDEGKVIRRVVFIRQPEMLCSIWTCVGANCEERLCILGRLPEGG